MVGDPFVLTADPNATAKVQKRRAAQRILRGLQETLLQSRLKQQVNLYNELLAAAEVYGQNMPIAEDITNAVTYKAMIRGAIALGGKLGPLTTGQQTVGLLLPTSIGHAVTLFALFTSGSESKPKGVVLTHENLHANIQQARVTIDVSTRDRIFNALPMFHSFGLTVGTLFPLLNGVPVYLYPSPLHYKQIPELVYEKLATVLFGTSTFLTGYGRTAHPYDFFSLRYVFAGAEKVKDDVRELWFNRFGVRILEGYGTTETAPILSLNSPMLNKPGSVGQLMPGLTYQIRPVEGIATGGELLVKGPNVMKGYYIYGKGFVPVEEWYATGDLVQVDEDGFVTVQSRLKRFAKLGGEMVSLNQVEELATQCFGHSDFASVIVKDERKGERVVLYTTDGEARLDQLRTYMNSHGYSPLLTPSAVRTIPAIPVLGSGKTDYVTLTQMAQAAATPQSAGASAS